MLLLFPYLYYLPLEIPRTRDAQAHRTLLPSLVDMLCMPAQHSFVLAFWRKSSTELSAYSSSSARTSFLIG
jgi:hypothetical protein